MLSILIVIVSCHHCNPVNPPPTCGVSFDLNSTSAYEISVAPAMPAISITLTSKSPTSATLSWSAKITHTAPGTNCGSTSVYEKTVTGSGDSFSPSFGGFYGDNLTVTATCSAAGYYSNTSTKTNSVIGIQPTDNAIVSEIGTVSTPFESPDLRRIGCAESNLTQFHPNGMPVYGFFGQDGDPGIMQTCWQRTNEFIWNWRANVARGRRILNDSKNIAKVYLDNEVNIEGATPYTTEYWRDEAIQRYNTGSMAGDEYRAWNNNTMKWDVVGGPYVQTVKNKGATCT